MEIMLKLAEFIKGVDLFAWLGAMTALCAALIAVFGLIPGEQPEKFLRGVLDVLTKFSRK
jgi:hypothetical protein